MKVRSLAFLKGINEKNEKAWEELYRYYYAPLCAYVEKMLGDSGVAEDIVQECLIRMWHAETTFTEVKALSAWLYKSVYHAAVSALREKKSHTRLLDTLKVVLPEEEEAREMAWQEEAISRFYDVLYQMPQQQRDILMYCLKGMTVQEIAALMHISENSIKTQKKRAYQFVRERFDVNVLQVLLALFTS